MFGKSYIYRGSVKMKTFLFITVIFLTVQCFGIQNNGITYQIDGEEVTFVFSQKMAADIREIASVGVAGTFNRWRADGEWNLAKDGKVWMLTKKLEEIQVPGNSGLPEYYFVVNGKINIYPDKNYKTGYKFLNKFVILTDNTAPKVVAENERLAAVFRVEYDNDNQLANFRNVQTGLLGNRKLYRSYHPFIASKKEHPLEKERLAAVQKFIENNKINAVINLSDEPSITALKKVPPYYKDLADKGSILFAETGYDMVFYRSTSGEFNTLLAKIFGFIGSVKGPYLVHCRLGTDRTGVVTAVIEAFMGAQWDEIVADYKRSNETGIGEYRDEKLLKYTFERMLGTGINNDTKLKPLMESVLTEKAGISRETLDRVFDNLK